MYFGIVTHASLPFTVLKLHPEFTLCVLETEIVTHASLPFTVLKLP